MLIENLDLLTCLVTGDCASIAISRCGSEFRFRNEQLQTREDRSASGPGS